MLQTKKKDLLIALLLAIPVFLACFFCLDGTQIWGDDFAGYLLEGIAMADGTLDAQLHENLYLHPSAFFTGSLTEFSRLVYVWAYPAMLSLVYRLVGYSSEIPNIMLYYKIPCLLCLTAMAPVLYGFFRRRFARPLSACGALVFCLVLVSHIHQIQTDIPFLLFLIMCLLLNEQLTEAQNKRYWLPLGTLLGISLWWVWELRLNGSTVLALCAAWQLLHLLRLREKKTVWLQRLYPFALAVSLYLGSMLFIPPASSNLGDVGSAAFGQYGLQTALILYNWLLQFTPIGFKLFRLLMLGVYIGCFVWGLLRTKAPEDWLYAAFILLNLLVLLTLPYPPAIRYLYQILPLFWLFALGGMADLWPRIPKKRAAAVVCTVLFGLVLAANVQDYTNHLQKQKALETNSSENAYTPNYLDAYRFIRENTPADALFLTYKPRNLRLNTDRSAFAPVNPCRKPEQADYLLAYVDDVASLAETLPEARRSRMELVYSNPDIEIYHLQ